MNIEVLDSDDSVAHRAAAIIAGDARAAIAARGRFVMAVSGGHTPWLMLRALANGSSRVAARVCTWRGTDARNRVIFVPAPLG